VKGPAGCGGTAIKAGLLEEYVTGAVLDALESPRVQQALRHGEDQDAPRRADLLAQIQDARERRDEARRDYAGRVIDRADWLDIRQRTEDEISAARREYDRLLAEARQETVSQSLASPPVPSPQRSTPPTPQPKAPPQTPNPPRASKPSGVRALFYMLLIFGRIGVAILRVVWIALFCSIVFFLHKRNLPIFKASFFQLETYLLHDKIIKFDS
jgi:hypothetical protein